MEKTMRSMLYFVITMCLFTAFSATSRASDPAVTLDLKVMYDQGTDSATIEWFSSQREQIAFIEVNCYDGLGQLSASELLPGNDPIITINQVSSNRFHEVMLAALDSKGFVLETSPIELLIPDQGIQSETMYDSQGISVSNAGPLDISLVSCNSQNFPFIYLSVQVFENGLPIDSLTQSNFSILEDSVLQTDHFTVTPPGSSGGVRIADIVFLIDNSGSMSSEIAGVKNNCEAFANALANSGVDYRLGLIQFGQSANGGNPQMFGSGLTSDVTEFKSWVALMPANGGYEPGFAAVRYAIQNYNFRVGAHKIFIIITDEDSDDRDKTSTINLIQANGVTVHCAVDCNYGSSNSDYCDSSSIRGVSGGLQLSVWDAYDQILNTIQQSISNTYIIKYRTFNDVKDGVERLVRCTVDNTASTDYLECTYIPGGSPLIRRTANTVALHKSALVSGATPTIAAEVTDQQTPFVQSVKLYVRTLNSGNAYSIINMPLEQGDTYSAVVPSGIVQEPGIEYYITATDGEVNASDPTSDAAHNPYQIAVLVNQAPVITHTPPTDWRQAQPLDLDIQATDDTYALTKLTVYYRHQGNLLWNSSSMALSGTSINETMSFAGTEMDAPVIEYYIEVVDDLGFSAFWPVRGVGNPYVLNGAPLLHVLCVGMDYGSSLNGRGDAHAVHNRLKKFDNYAPTNPEPLILDPCQATNKATLQQSLNAIESNLVPGDSFIFYFSGHGGVPGSGNGNETAVKIKGIDNTNDEYLCLETPFSSWSVQLSDDDIINNAWLGSDAWDQVDKWLLFDSCHSGGFEGDNNQNDIGDLEKLPRCALWAAATEAGLSHSLPNGRGMWTTLFLVPALSAYNTVEDIANFINSIDLSSFIGQVLGLRQASLSTSPYGNSNVFDMSQWNPGFYQSEDFSMNLTAADGTYSLTALVASGNGTITPAAGSYNEDTVVTLTAMPAPGFRVHSWNGTDNDASKATINTVVMDADKTVTVAFESKPLYRVTVSVSGGNGSVSPTGGLYYDEDIMTLTATPDPGYKVKAWHGTDNDSSTANSNTVTIDDNKTVTVEFEENVCDLEVMVNGSGSVTPSDGTYDYGDIVTLTALPDAYSSFVSWNGTDDDALTTLTNTVTMNEDKTVTANFETVYFDLTTEVLNGNGTIAPESQAYPGGTSVTVTAVPNDDYQVKAWQGTVDDSSTATTNTVMMDADKTVSVEFEPVAAALTTQVIGGHGTISPEGGPYPVGTVVALTATPDEYYQVKAWQGTNDDSSTALTNGVQLNENTTVSVEFEPIPVMLTVNQVGSGGNIPLTSGPRDMGTVEALSVSLEPGYRIVAWHGTDDDSCLDPNNTVTMTSNKVVTVEIASMVELDTTTIKAGRSRGRDSISVSGQFSPTAQQLANDTTITIKVWSQSGFSFEAPIMFSPEDMNNGKFTYKEKIKKNDPAGISFFSFDVESQSFELELDNIDATGLSAPLFVSIAIDEYIAMAEEAAADIFPVEFLKSESDSLRLDKAKIKLVDRLAGDALIFKGQITFADTPNFNDHPMVITFGSQSFTVPAGSFTEKNGKWFCKKVSEQNGNGIVDIKIIPDKCDFTIKISDINVVPVSYPTDLNLSFGTFDQTVSVEE